MLIKQMFLKYPGSSGRQQAARVYKKINPLSKKVAASGIFTACCFF